MYHYTYIIQSKTTEMRYIGVRSSQCLPIEDIEYWGSSKHLPANVKETHSKIILKVHNTRKEAIQHEVIMHALNDVAVSPVYYNKAKQLTTGFDTTGKPRVFTHTHRENLSKAHLAACAKPGYVNPRKGVTVSAESRAKNSATKKADPRPAHVKAPRFTPWFITDVNVTHLFYTTTKQEYALTQGVTPGTYRDLATKSKGIRPIAHGKYKGLIVGNIPA